MKKSLLAMVALSTISMCIGLMMGCKTNEMSKEQLDECDHIFQHYYQAHDFDALLKISPTLAESIRENAVFPMVGFYYGVVKTMPDKALVLRKAVEKNESLRTVIDDVIAGRDDSIAKLFDLSPKEYTPPLLDFFWGYFMATGDKTVVEKVVRRGAMRVPSCCTVDLTAAAARWSVNSLAKTHPVVKEVLDDFLSHATEAEKKEFLQLQCGTAVGSDPIGTEGS